ncbi:unnamed protein product [Schistocephalus solidus]|uniref:Amine oxidase n=1 Tax=Schistocephalus solidus TaxID=70667 RepID=A0A183SZV6_SCHSO|nr:unnamed protein product [Schistocephalus solidus]
MNFAKWTPAVRQQPASVQPNGSEAGRDGRSDVPAASIERWSQTCKSIDNDSQRPGAACQLQVASTVQVQLFQLSEEAEKACSFEHFCVQEPVLSSQHLCSSEATEVDVVQLPRLPLVDPPCLRYIQQRRQHDSFVHLDFGAEVEIVSSPDHVLHASKGLAGFGDPIGDPFVDFGAAGEIAAQTSARAGQLFDVEVGAAAGDLIYAFYVHDLDPNKRTRISYHRGVSLMFLPYEFEPTGLQVQRTSGEIDSDYVDEVAPTESPSVNADDLCALR